MVEYVPAKEVDAWLGLFWGWSLLLPVDLQGDCILVHFLSEIVSEFKSSHQVVAVFDRLDGPLGGFSGLDFDDLVLGEWVDLLSLSNIDFHVLVFSLFEHLSLLTEFLFIRDEDLLAGLTPNSDALVTTDSDEIVTERRGCDAPHFTKEVVEHKDFLISVTVNHLDFLVFGSCQNVVGVLDEPD